ncbi:MAG TPA: DUF664 domain-containing protein [Actinomycetota bacterium]|jgi:hypothetical protein
MTDPVLVAARAVLDEGLDGLRRSVGGATVELLNRRPAVDETNSIAVIVTHALHSTRAWLSLGVGVEPPPRDRPAEFRTVVDDVDAFLASVDAITADCRALVDDASAFEPERTGVATWTPEPQTVTAAWALLHALEHLGEHAAHAQLTRQVLDGA